MFVSTNALTGDPGEQRLVRVADQAVEIRIADRNRDRRRTLHATAL
jgi:hypothetical protein